MASKKSKGILGQTAIEQLIEKSQKSRKKPLNRSEIKELIAKVESSCHRFDKIESGKLSVKDLYNVVKLQNKIECSREDIEELAEELGIDKQGNVSIKDFIHDPIISKAVFDLMDKNKDGYVTKGELKLAKKDISMKELSSVIDGVDKDSDGKLTYEEIKAINRKVRGLKK